MVSSLSESDSSPWRPRIFFLAVFFILFVASSGFRLSSFLVALAISTVFLLFAFAVGRPAVVIFSEDEEFTPTDEAEPPPPTPPRPFSSRLAQYVRRDVKCLDGVQAKRRSRMVFWSVVPLGPETRVVHSAVARANP